MMTPGDKPGYLFFRTFCQEFNVTVRPVSYPPIYPQFVCLSAGRIPEPHALDPAADNHPNPYITHRTSLFIISRGLNLTTKKDFLNYEC
jgi:hypothetical protein